MGIYLNPTNMTKEAYLEKYGTQVNTPPAPAQARREGKMPICLVDNGPFKAAAVAFDDREMEAFTQMSDWRPKTWYIVETSQLVHDGFLPINYLMG